MDLLNKSKTYKVDSKLMYSCHYHVIFTTKYRRPVLVDGVDAKLKELILSKQHELGFEVLEMEVMPDHVHLLLDANPKTGIYQIVCGIKGFSSKMLRDEFTWLKSRIPSLWTRSMFISSVGAVSLEVVKKYITEQKSQ